MLSTLAAKEIQRSGSICDESPAAVGLAVENPERVSCESRATVIAQFLLIRKKVLHEFFSIDCPTIWAANRVQDKFRPCEAQLRGYVDRQRDDLNVGQRRRRAENLHAELTVFSVSPRLGFSYLNIDPR